MALFLLLSNIVITKEIYRPVQGIQYWICNYRSKGIHDAKSL